MSVLSGQASVPKGQLHEATKVLVTILDKSGDPRIVYTHHPAILFWAFSSYNINLKLQIIVMSLWLENEDGSSNVQVMHLILANPDASFCLLDIIQQGAPKIVEQATHILSKAIEYEGKKGAEDLIVMLWDTLPLVLAKYNSRSNLMEPVNLINFIRVACTSIPSAPSTTTIFRTASLLISLLTHKSDHSELTAIAMQLALHLLVVSVKLKDERVLTLYVTHEHFLETLKQGVEKTDTILPSLKLLTHILQLQHNYKIWSQQQLKRHCRVGIEAGQLLSLLASKDISILTLSLQVLYLLLESKLPSPTIRIMMQGSEVVSTRFVQVYFLKLQNLCLMNLPGITNSSWKCMGSVLFYAANCHPDPKLMPLLATQPWTHMLIRFTVPTKDAELSCECLYFLCQWLQYYNVNSDTVQYGNLRKSRGKSRAPYPDLLSISVNRLAPVLMMTADINITTQRTQLILLVISMILGPITELEPEIEAALKQKLLDSKVISK